EIPLQLDELNKGLSEMKQQGYAIDDLDLKEEINHYQSRLLDMVKELEDDGAETIRTVIHEMESRITEIYDILEEEAIARNYVETKVPSYERALDAFETEFLRTQNEVEELRHAYYFEDTDMEQFVSLDNMLEQLKEQLKS